jgi:uncharacterized damage-inducible protein DinB
MSKLELISAFCDYSEWSNKRLLKTASELSAEEFSRPQGASWGSVESSFGHIVGAQIIWLSRWRTATSPGPIVEVQAIAGLEGITSAFEASHAGLREFVAGLTDQILEGVLAFTDSRGNTYQSALWELMLHVANHGTYHRGEIAMALTALGHSPGDLDYRRFQVGQERSGG